ncbi:MAG: efflux RND transporter periplasmic adaptor subunit [Rhizobiales bacterium]|nr:efflux RND transporter periplasmic adaptor subunit [Hyphomicrobiales bacterium]
MPDGAGAPVEAATPVLSRRMLRFSALLIAGLAAAVVGLGINTRKTADARLNAWTESQAVPYVSVIAPDAKARRISIDLPGRLEAYAQAQLFARVSGYLKDRHVDMGASVKAGQLLAEIDAPDLDQQIMQAVADLASAEANVELARTTLERAQSLIRSGAVAQQTLEQRQAEFSNRRGLVRSAQANLDRLRVLEKYKQITAPFDGIVTARATDVGALINAGSGAGPALFVLSDTSKLRVYVNVPQNYVPSIQIGTKAEIRMPEYPGRTFAATVEASSQSVDGASGTTRMQLVVENPRNELMTGAFANVRLILPQPETTLSVPASALIFGQDGLRIAVVGADERVSLKPVTIARDHGREVEIGSGIAAGDRVVDSPPDGIAEGDKVRLVRQ